MNRHLQPKQQTGVPAGEPEMDSNIFSVILIILSAVFFTVWFLLASPVIVLLGIFPVSSLVYLIFWPVLTLIVIPRLVANVCVCIE
jgi:hypothetical protein